MLETQPQPAALAAELRVLLGRMKRRLRDQTDAGGLSWTQLAVLGHLETAGKATVTSLAREEGMRPQSMGTVVAMLQEAGLITGVPDPADGRQTILSLAPAGQARIHAGRASRQDWLSAAIQTRLTPAQQAALGDALALLKRLAEP